jgi:polyphosphate kinase 2 (PPK2 family)
VQERLARPPAAKPAPPPPPAPEAVSVIRKLDLTQKVSDKEYDAQLPKLQGRLSLLTRHLAKSERGVVLVFEGNDAAGKGGAIRRLIHGMDARAYRIIPIAAPTDEERAQPYLWRFWRHIPRLGRVTIFDRSWYGRVLVERIEGYCREADWKRAYHEINEFEEQLTDFGLIVLKFWLAIGKDEQMRRFKERETTAYKKYKITEEDWRNREKWDAYEAAVCDMVEKTSDPAAPWVLVAASDKKFARLKIIKTITDRLAKTVD